MPGHVFSSGQDELTRPIIYDTPDLEMMPNNTQVWPKSSVVIISLALKVLCKNGSLKLQYILYTVYVGSRHINNSMTHTKMAQAN